MKTANARTRRTGKSTWSCEFSRGACRNPHGCHCREIEDLSRPPAKPVRTHVEAAAHCYADLTVFAAVQVLLESSFLHGPRAKAAARRIITICKSEQSRAVDGYDLATARALGATEIRGARLRG